MSATVQPLPRKNWWDVGLNPTGGLSANGATQYSQPPDGGWQNMAQITAPSSDTAFSALQNASFGPPKQDTGGGESAQGPWSDNTPRQGGNTWAPAAPNPSPPGQTSGGPVLSGGTYGTTYADPGGGWNPVSLLDARNGYDGTAVDGHYNAAADTAKWTNNGQPELDRARVWRWTMDDLKGDFSDQERVKQTFLANVARLKRDYANTPGMNWQGSAFSGYDRFAQGGQGGGPNGQVIPNSRPMKNDQPGSVVINGGGQPPPGQTGQGGNAVNPLPPYGQGAAAGAAAAGVTAQPGGSVPPVPPVVPPGGGTAGNAVPAGAYYRTNPGVAVSQFLQQHNIGTGDHGPFADFLRKLATGIATPVMSVMPPGANGQSAGDQLNNLPSIINNLIYGNGGQVFGNLANFAGQAQGQFGPDKLKGMSFPDVQGLLSTINALKTMGQNPYMQSFNQQALADLFQKYQNTDFAGNQAGTGSTNPDWLTNPQNDPYGLFR